MLSVVTPLPIDPINFELSLLELSVLLGKVPALQRIAQNNGESFCTEAARAECCRNLLGFPVAALLGGSHLPPGGLRYRALARVGVLVGLRHWHLAHEPHDCAREPTT